MSSKPTVLFIDDDSFMLKALLRAAMRLRPDWHYYFSDDSANWQAALPTGVVPDLIVSDYLMPALQGNVLLTQAMALLPETVRVLMTGDTSEDVVSSVSRQAHFVLSKPFNERDFLDLFQSVEQTHRLPVSAEVREMLGNSALLMPLPSWFDS